VATNDNIVTKVRSPCSTQILQLAAKSAHRADESPFVGFAGVNPDKMLRILRQSKANFCYGKI
jgi:hypothetical protein